MKTPLTFLFFFLLSLSAMAQVSISLPDLSTTVAANTSAISGKQDVLSTSSNPEMNSVSTVVGLKPGAMLTTTVSSSATYTMLYEAKTLPPDQVYILTVYINKSEQEFTTQLYYVGINQKSNSHSESPDLSPFLVDQTSGTTNAAVAVRYRKPQTAFDVGMWGIEVRAVSSVWEASSVTYSLTPLIKVPH